jgi:protein-S-isoprenylcysteine O-methyltransferase Ste14
MVPLVRVVYLPPGRWLIPLNNTSRDILMPLSVVFIVIGSAFSFIGVLELRNIINEKSKKHRLKIDGIFSVSRNPITFGLHLTYIGFVLAVPSWMLIFGFTIYVLHMHKKIKIEEEHLLSEFKYAYARYKKKVGRYFLWF